MLFQTGVGDDGVVGRASEYDVRYSTTSLTEANWEEATSAIGEDTPSDPGATETFVLSGLQPAIDYWIGVKARDNSGQFSPLSNIIEIRTLIPAEILVNPLAMPHVILLPETTSSEVISISNSGEEPLTFELSVTYMPEAVSTGQVTIVEGTTENDSAPSVPDGPSPFATYTGVHLQVGITDYGEIMPLQYPIGTEHLAVGAHVSGYTLAYRSAGSERLAYASNSTRSGILPISYEEIENSTTRVLVRVVTGTSDGALRITRVFDYALSGKHIGIETTVENISAAPLDEVVLKKFTDWDVDNSYEGDTFDTEEEANLLFAFQSHYVGTASSRVPDFQDLDGWDDYQRRITDGNEPSRPLLIDGMVLLHFELGDLLAGASDTLETVYAVGDTLDELRSEVGFNRWLSADITSGLSLLVQPKTSCSPTTRPDWS